MKFTINVTHRTNPTGNGFQNAEEKEVEFQDNNETILLSIPWLFNHTQQVVIDRAELIRLLKCLEVK